MLKRVFDVLAAAFALILVSPIIALLAIAVAVSMGRPIFFRQTRAGLGGRDFTLIKFRSMRIACAADGQPLPDEARVTPIGRIMRRFRLDELPELWQILIGDMSFVGPRPLPRALLEERGVLATRCRLRPGLTGLAQVSGNTLLNNTEKFAVDLFYVDHESLIEDLRIIGATLRTVVTGERRDESLIQKALRYANHSDRCSR